MTHETDQAGRRLLREFSSGRPFHRALLEGVGIYKELIAAIPLEVMQATQDAALQRRRDTLVEEPHRRDAASEMQAAALQRRRGFKTLDT